MELIEGVIRHYDWGSPTAIPELLGRPATGEPWAELWLGAHPAAPAKVGVRAEPLDRLIAADPVTALGSEVAARSGRLPFLLKVLAAASPLSLQAHPSARDAAAGFEREEAMGIPRDGPQRMFRDRSPKPELICALGDFEALCGFRDPQRTAALLDTLDGPGLDPLRRRIDGLPGPQMRDVLGWLLSLEQPAAAALAAAAADACAASRDDDEWSGLRAAVAELGTSHPGDAAVAVALLLNHVVLAPGEALFLDAGCLHAYLGGTAVELMAESDNVVRAGLTSKHVDPAVLIEIVDGAPSGAPVQHPEPVDGVVTYSTPAPEFSLRRLEVDGSLTVTAGPSVLLCTGGCVDANGLTMDRGAAAWVGADEPRVVFHGRGTVFCATVGNHR
ncbi:MAG: mannose-6-phosphate isomerase, class I [Acidimicrobiaceae bacterium]|nr:mannose-6-phosphate isomerase, class I [Acidimicrobiaceae bacterium]MYA14290.1 mannose-6-phosphate isomerase, class I [Acidimicrobiaceae bacterium]